MMIRYEGGFRHNVKHGKGKQMWANGDSYEVLFAYFVGQSQVRLFAQGDWAHGLQHGQGTFTWGENSGMNASNVYTGDWKEGVREGRGTLTWANGSTYTGSWKNDHRHGEKRVQEVRIV